MVVALFVVAFAMIAAGSAAVYDGYGIVAVEKGWTKVISGTVAASAGVVLLGILAALVQLRRIGADLAFVREQAARLDAPLPAPAVEAEEPLPALGETLALGAPTATVSGGLSPDAAAEEPSRDAEEAAIPPEPPPTDERARSLEASVRSSPEQGREPAPERQAAPKEAAPQQEPVVVGTYASGGNTYVMYSDGSIQAQTPTGLYRFASLDELKAFIAAGGESVPPAR